ncbi:MAG: hypothetical protein JW751_03330 [Polyangiaceae bacterium]|nr:hypothetical protein [Polyangiaceae bacterium]
MRVKTEQRHLRALGIEATARSVRPHLREDPPLDPARIGVLVGRRGSPYQLFPDCRLTRRSTDPPLPADGIAAADALLHELADCVQDVRAGAG